MSIILGDGPDRLTVKLSRFGDFAAALIYDDGDPLTANEWPVDVDIELRFYASRTDETTDVTWPATITGDRAEWHIPAADVDTDILDAGFLTVRLFYITPVATLQWAVGAVKGAD